MALYRSQVVFTRNAPVADETYVAPDEEASIAAASGAGNAVARPKASSGAAPPRMDMSAYVLARAERHLRVDGDVLELVVLADDLGHQATAALIT